MLKPYVSKRRKVAATQEESTTEHDEKASLPLSSLKWSRDLHFDCLSRELQSYANQIDWSSDGLFLATGTLNGDLSLISFSKCNKLLDLHKLVSLQTIPRTVYWSQGNKALHLVSHDAQSYNIDMNSGKFSKGFTFKIKHVNAAVSWNDCIILGYKQLHIYRGDKLQKIFGPVECHVSSMIVVESVLYVAYDYSQTSSSHKSIIAFSLPSGAPVSNKLTDSLFSYTCLVHSAPFIYGMTANGEITRFHSRAPFKNDIKFKVKVEVSPGFKNQFDIKNGIIVYGNSKGSIEFISLPGFKQSIPVPVLSDELLKSESPIVNVRFNPIFNCIAVSKWDGTFAIVRY